MSCRTMEQCRQRSQTRCRLPQTLRDTPKPKQNFCRKQDVPQAVQTFNVGGGKLSRQVTLHVGQRQGGTLPRASLGGRRDWAKIGAWEPVWILTTGSS